MTPSWLRKRPVLRMAFVTAFVWFQVYSFWELCLVLQDDLSLSARTICVLAAALPWTLIAWMLHSGWRRLWPMRRLKSCPGAWGPPYMTDVVPSTVNPDHRLGLTHEVLFRKVSRISDNLARARSEFNRRSTWGQLDKESQ